MIPLMTKTTHKGINFVDAVAECSEDTQRYITELTDAIKEIMHIRQAQANDGHVRSKIMWGENSTVELFIAVEQWKNERRIHGC